MDFVSIATVHQSIATVTASTNLVSETYVKRTAVGSSVYLQGCTIVMLI